MLSGPFAQKSRRLGDGHDVIDESKRLVGAAQAAIENLRPYLIRHGIDDLTVLEKKHFGNIDDKPWEILTASASEEEIKLLLRMDRVLQLAPERKGARHNDPRFHIGWQHVDAELERAKKRSIESADHALLRHIEMAKKSLRAAATLQCADDGWSTHLKKSGKDIIKLMRT